MALILAIEPDSRQAAQLAGIVRHRLNAELLLGDTTEQALDAIGDRIPDLVLIPALLSPQDDTALAAALRVIAAAANVRTLTIPVFAASAPREASRSMLGRWRRARATATPDGCDPAVFAEQISTYLAEAVAERAALAPDLSFDEPVIESTRIETGYLVESPAPIESTAIAYEPLIVPDEELPSVISSAAADFVFDERPADPAPAIHDFEPTSFESVDVIEIDLSGDTLEEAVEDESVFELSLEDGAEALAGMQATAAANVAIEPEAVETVAAINLDAAVDLGSPIELATAVDFDIPAAVDATPEFGAPIGLETPLFVYTPFAAGMPIDAAVEAEAPTVPLAEAPAESVSAPVAAVESYAPLAPPTFEIFENDDLLPPPTADIELWMPLSCGAARLWPTIEGAAAEYVDLFADAAPAPAPPKAEHPEWTELIASLRQDMERRRDTVDQKPIARVVPRRKTKPVQDEWGFFDPQQCGFAALLAKLDEITEVDEPTSRRA